jgi:FtsH-binding integral membrane protein
LEYVDCYFGCGDPLFFVGLLLAAVVTTFLAVRRGAWTFVVGLTSLPLAEWYLDGAQRALVVSAALLVGGLAGLAMREKRKHSASSEAA